MSRNSLPSPSPPAASKPGPNPTLDFFAVYAPDLGPTEDTETEQLLYFYPEDTNIDTKIKRIGLAQGLVNFTRTFSPARPCQNAHSQKSRMTIMEVEPGYWMLLRIKLGVATMPGKDGKEVMEYLDTRLSDSTCEEMLKEAYRLFKLLHSTPSQITASHSSAELRKRLRSFFNSYVKRWIGPDTISDLPLVRTWGGLDLLTLDRETYHEVLAFVYGVEDWRGSSSTEDSGTDSVISSTVLLWRSQVIWNGLRNLDDLAAVYDLLTDPSVFAAVSTEIRDPNASKDAATCPVPGRALGFNKDGAVVTSSTPEPVDSKSVFSAFTRRPPSVIPSKLPFSGFLTGPLNLSDSHAPIVLQNVYIDGTPTSFPSAGQATSSLPSSQLKEHSMLVYRHMDEFTLLFFMPVDSEAAGKRVRELEFYNSLEAYMRPRLDGLLPLVKEEWKNRKRGSDFIEENYRYLYLNNTTLALRTSLGSSKSTRASEDLLRLLVDLRPTLDTCTDFSLRFTAPNGKQDFWVVCRARDGRELWVVLPGTKNGTLGDVEGEIESLTASFFGDGLAA